MAARRAALVAAVAAAEARERRLAAEVELLRSYVAGDKVMSYGGKKYKARCVRRTVGGGDVGLALRRGEGSAVFLYSIGDGAGRVADTCRAFSRRDTRRPRWHATYVALSSARAHCPGILTFTRCVLCCSVLVLFTNRKEKGLRADGSAAKRRVVRIPIALPSGAATGEGRAEADEEADGLLALTQVRGT